ncbi:hypothetical protein [Actinokineospora inagensis]|uniref:hypothetical protein n=1 Tax=Actinokineospora inagensis TaxID=103730 RepID=UPI0004031546|nr:hypothetical protein [Actinokineospora inagensis]
MNRIALVLAAVIATGVAVAPVSDAATMDTFSADRATVRDYPGRLVLANAAKGDKAELTAHCGDWVRVRVTAAHTMATPVGWVLRGNLTKAAQAGGLDSVPEQCGTDGDRWRDWVGAINAPFHSLRKTTVDGVTGWRRITFGTGVKLAAGCVPSLNYTRVGTGPDVVDPTQQVTDLDLGQVSYRYVTTDGAVALVSAPRSGSSYGVWAFVPSTCLVPKGRATVYFNEPVVQVTTLDGLKTGVQYPDGSVRKRGCSAAVASPSYPSFGYWPDPQPENRPACPV